VQQLGGFFKTEEKQ